MVMGEERFLALLEEAWPERYRSEAMTPAERLMTALCCGTPDRVPVVLPGFHLYRWADASYINILQQIARLADPIYDVFLNYDPVDCLAAATVREMIAGDGTTLRRLSTPAGDLTEILKPTAGGSVHQNHAKLWLSTLDDVQCFLSIPPEPRRRDVSHIEALRDRLGAKALTVVTLCEPVECLHDMCGTTAFSLWYMDERPTLKHVLDVLFERIMDELDYWLQIGLAPVYRISGSELCLPPMMAPRVYHELCVPYEKAMIELIHAHGCKAIVHCHSGISKALPSFTALGADGTDPCEPPPLGDLDLAEGKRLAAGRTSLWGNIEYNLLAEAPEDQIEVLVREAIARGAPGGGFVLLPCARLYENSLPARMERNLLRYLQAGRQYGRYPLVA